VKFPTRNRSVSEGIIDYLEVKGEVKALRSRCHTAPYGAGELQIHESLRQTEQGLKRETYC